MLYICEYIEFVCVSVNTHNYHAHIVILGTIFWYNSVTKKSQWLCPFDASPAGPTSTSNRNVTVRNKREATEVDTEEVHQVHTDDDLGI